MHFQLQMRDLLSNASQLYTRHKLAQVGPEMLRSLYDEGMEPTAQALIEHRGGRRKQREGGAPLTSGRAMPKLHWKEAQLS